MTMRINLRWASVLPASLLSAILVSIPVHIFLVIAYWLKENSFDEEETWGRIPFERAELMAFAFCCGWAAVSAASAVAPSHKLAVALCSAIIWVVLVNLGHGAAVVYVNLSDEYRPYQFGDWIQFAVTVVLHVAGPLFALKTVGEKEGVTLSDVL